MENLFNWHTRERDININNNKWKCRHRHQLKSILIKNYLYKGFSFTSLILFSTLTSYRIIFINSQLYYACNYFMLLCFCLTHSHCLECPSHLANQMESICLLELSLIFPFFHWTSKHMNTFINTCNIYKQVYMASMFPWATQVGNLCCSGVKCVMLTKDTVLIRRHSGFALKTLCYDEGDRSRSKHRKMNQTIANCGVLKKV